MLTADKIQLIKKSIFSAKITKDVLYTITSKLTVYALTFIRTVFLVRFLLPEYYGEFAVIFSWSIIVSTVFDLGLGLGFLIKRQKVISLMQNIDFPS